VEADALDKGKKEQVHVREEKKFLENAGTPIAICNHPKNLAY
jgi:hypothetical protein